MIAKNNPFNIRWSKHNLWLGLEGSTKGFCNFVDMEHGIRAGMKLLLNYVYKKDIWTVEKLVSRYAPSSENDTSSYIRFVSDSLRTYGFDPFDLRSEFILEYDKKFFYLCKVILKMETGYVFTYPDYIRIVKMFNLKKELYGLSVNR